MSISAPPYMPMAWGSGTGANVGVINSAIWTTFTSAAPGNASLNDGFPIQQMAPSGTPPQGGDMNAILNWITTFQTWVNAGGRFLFNSALCTAIGGYPAGMVVQLAGRQYEVVSTVTTSTDPNTLTAAQLAAGAGGWILYAGNASVLPYPSSIAVRDINGYLNAVRFVGSGAGLSTNTIPTAALANGTLPSGVIVPRANISNGVLPVGVTLGARWLANYNGAIYLNLSSGSEMLGMMSSQSFTPTRSGTIVATVTVVLGTAVGTAYGTFFVQYGTGTGPANGAAVVGTAVNTSGAWSGWGGSVTNLPIPITIPVTLNLTVGVAYWIDAGCFFLSGSGTESFSALSLMITEL